MNNQHFFIDAHCHIDLFSSPIDIASNLQGMKVIAVTNTPSSFNKIQSQMAPFNSVNVALGLHPEYANSHGNELSLFFEQLKQAQFIGEIGLDYVTKDASERRVQRQVFSQILDHCAFAKGKILSVHSRRATTDVIDAIGMNYPCKVILHWFSGSLTELEKALNYGMYFSINNAMLSSNLGKELIRKIPTSRVLTETDGPFTNDEKGNPATPLCIEKVVSKLARIWEMDSSEAKVIISSNYSSL